MRRRYWSRSARACLGCCNHGEAERLDVCSRCSELKVSWRVARSRGQTPLQTPGSLQLLQCNIIALIVGAHRVGCRNAHGIAPLCKGGASTSQATQPAQPDMLLHPTPQQGLLGGKGHSLLCRHTCAQWTLQEHMHRGHELGALLGFASPLIDTFLYYVITDTGQFTQVSEATTAVACTGSMISYTPVLHSRTICLTRVLTATSTTTALFGMSVLYRYIRQCIKIVLNTSALARKQHPYMEPSAQQHAKPETQAPSETAHKPHQIKCASNTANQLANQRGAANILHALNGAKTQTN